MEIENLVQANIIRLYRESINGLRSRRLLLSQRYFNNPPVGGYVINDDDEYVFSESELVLFDNDDLSSLTFLDTLNHILNVNSTNSQNNNNNIPNKNKGYKKVKDTDTKILELQCPICIDTFCLRECYRKLNCDHYFHKKCIDRWVKRDKNECPMCRGNIH